MTPDFNRYLAKCFPPVVWEAMAASEKLFHTHPRARPGHNVEVTGFRADDLRDARPPSVDPVLWVRYCYLIAGDANRAAGSQVELWTSAGMCAHGLRCYRPTAAEFLALGMTDVSVSFGDYRQPYECFVTVVPPDLPNRSMRDVGNVSAVLTRWSPGRGILSHTVFGDGTGGLNVNGFYVWHDDPSELVSARMEAWRTVDKAELPEFKSGLYVPLDDDEEEFYRLCLRAAFNANLLLANYGAREVGPANPAHAERCKETLRKKSAPEGAKANARNELRRMPTVFTIDQHVDLLDRHGRPADAGDPTGRHVRCHWRRGHWARQPHGEGRSLRKMIYRKPLLVHADEFGGSASATRVTYS